MVNQHVIYWLAYEKPIGVDYHIAIQGAKGLEVLHATFACTQKHRQLNVFCLLHFDESGELQIYEE